MSSVAAEALALISYTDGRALATPSSREDSKAVLHSALDVLLVSGIPDVPPARKVYIANLPIELMHSDRLREMLQLLASGSKRLLAVGLSRDRRQVVEIREKTLSGEICSSEAWSKVGQRIRYLLPRILDDPRVVGAVERPVHLVFDHSKLPVLKVAPPGCGVVDPAWQALFGGDDGDVE